MPAPSEKLERSQTVLSIQALRAVAAIAVLVPHITSDFARYLNRPDAFPNFAIGGAGVDLFFVISGFVMVYASERLYQRDRGSLIFITHRIIRIVPLYWLVTTLYLVVSFALPDLSKNYPAAFLIGSYLFIPIPRPDGVMEPLVGQGWTLVYEMLFYAIFAGMLFLTRRKAVMAASAVLIALVILGRLFPNMPPTLQRWCDPIIIEFIFGMSIGLAYREGLTLNSLFAAGLIVLGIVILALAQSYQFSQARALAAGIPAALVVLGSTAGRFSRLPILAPLFLLLGDASYALYLFHPIVSRFFIVVSRHVGFDLAHFPIAYFFASFVVAIVAAIVLHECLERPVTRYLRARSKFIEGTPLVLAKSESVRP